MRTKKIKLPSAQSQVKEYRQEISSEIRGEELRPLLCAKLEEKGLPIDQKPYSTLIDRFCGKLHAKRDPQKALAKGLDPDPLNSILKTYKYRAYPTIASDLRMFDVWGQKIHYFWDAAAIQIQHAIRNNEWSRLKILTARKEYEAYFDKLVGNSFPKEIKRDVLSRFSKVIAKGKASGENKGYPMSKKSPPRITLNIPFNGMGFSSYVNIGNPYFPPNHRGLRNGKYRKLKEMRKVGLRLNTKTQYFEFDVLFHEHLQGYPKSAKIMKDGPKWFVMFSMETKLPQIDANERRFAGLDINWRKDKIGRSVLDVGAESFPRESFSLGFSENRRTRRQKLMKSKDAIGLPLFLPTPEGRKEYQREMDKRKEELKTKLGLHQKMGWAGIKKTAASGSLLPDSQLLCNETIAWYDRALKQFAFMCDVETKNRNYQYITQIARGVLAYCQKYKITDIGSPNDGYKEMAEEERKDGLKNFESHILNVRDESRQIVAPGQLRQTVEWILKKAGIRIHRINPWKTSQRCACGSDTKSRDETFTCSGCGQKLHRGDVAVSNAAKLARECSGTDAHSRACSHNGKTIKYHGFQGCDEAIAEKKAKKKLSRSQRQPQLVPEEALAV